jgi:cytochrome P450
MKNMNQIPELPGGGLLGHMTAFRTDPMGFLRRLVDGGDLFRLGFIGGSAVVATAPRLVQEVLIDQAGSFEKTAVLRYLLHPVLGEGIFTSRGEKWRRQRRLMAPFFQPAQLAHHAGCMVDCTQQTMASFQDGDTVDLLREATRISMGVASRTLFGTDTSLMADDVSAAVAALQEWTTGQMATLVPVLQGVMSRSLERLADRLPEGPAALARELGARLHGPVLLRGEEGQRVKEAVAALDRCVQQMIDERRAAGPDGGRPDLLNRLLAARDAEDGGRMSDKEVRDEVLTLLIAGFETTASSLAWSLYLLARHPAAYRRVQAEADALGRTPRGEDLPRLGYTLQVFKEALRLYPPSAIFSWEAYADVSIGGYHLPAGTIVFVSPYATHHRADLWPEPERFDPERFSPRSEEGRPRHAYFPFGAGPRVCIASHLALMEGPLVLATLLREVDLELAAPGPIEPEFQATLRPRGGVPMRVRRRRAAGAGGAP